MRSIPWDEWFRHGVIDLGLSPDAFWRLTVWEWRALTAARPFLTMAESDLLRHQMADLMAAHPDRTKASK